MFNTLTNFNTPITVRKRFDAICHARGRTRTSVLVELMTNYILEEGSRLAEQHTELGNLDIRLQECLGLRGSRNKVETSYRSTPSPRQTWGDAGDDIPSAIFSDGQEDW